jgi:hypothetical protein
MHLLVTLAIVSCLALTSHAFLLSPSIYAVPHANKTICQSDAIDDTNIPGRNSPNPLPYMTCADNGLIKVFKCTHRLATSGMCVLNFPGMDRAQPNSPRRLFSDESFENTDCTLTLKKLCDNKEGQCNFCHNMLAQPVIRDLSNGQTEFVDKQDLAFQVEFTCTSKRPAFRPFSNKRYSSKFHPTLNHPLRKMSYNRLQQL